MIALRRETFDFGILPASFLVPRAESVASLAPIQRRLLQCAYPSRADPAQTVVTLTDAAQALGITHTNAAHVIDTMHAVAPSEPPTPNTDTEPDGLPNEPEVRVHHLLQFLFVQTFARPHAQSSLRESGSGLEHTGFHTEAGGTRDGDGNYNTTASPPRAGMRSPGSPHGSPAKRARSSNGSVASHGLVSNGKEDQLREAFTVHHFNALAGLLVEDESRSAEVGGSSPGGGGGGNVCQLTAAEVDHLEFLFREVRRNDDAGDELDADGTDGGGPRRLSAMTGLFAGADAGALVPASAVRDWIASALGHYNPGEVRSPLGSPSRHTSGASSSSSSGSGSSVGSLTIEIEGLHRGTRVLRDVDVPAGASVVVRGCADAVVYLLAPFPYVTVANCVDCVVVVGACARALRVEQCERLTLIAAAKRVTAKLCHEGRFHLGVEKRPVFVGENRGCKVAPYNTWYEQLEKHLETCGLDASACRGWDAPVVLGASEGTVGTGVELLSAENFAPFSVPFRGTSSSSSSTQANPFAVPPEYVRALDTKVRAVASLRLALRDAGLGEHAKRELNLTIQAFFREWLTSSGSMRQVYDLARIERGE